MGFDAQSMPIGMCPLSIASGCTRSRKTEMDRLLKSRLVEKIEQMDVPNAYINNDLNEVVYMNQPDGFAVDDSLCLSRYRRSSHLTQGNN